VKKDSDNEFNLDEMKGVLHWNDVVAHRRLFGFIHHCCHRSTREAIIDSWCLRPCSPIFVKSPQRLRPHSLNYLWSSVNGYEGSTGGSPFGPVQLAFPVGALSGKNFVFVRRGARRYLIECNGVPRNQPVIRPG